MNRVCHVWSLQGVLDNIRSKIEKLEKAIAAQTVDCREPCTTKCPIPVVSGEWTAGPNQQLHRQTGPLLAGFLTQNYLWRAVCLLCDSGKECEDVYRRGGKDSQMYLIQPDQSTLPFKVFCDQTGHSGGEHVTSPSNVQLFISYSAFIVKKQNKDVYKRSLFFRLASHPEQTWWQRWLWSPLGRLWQRFWQHCFQNPEGLLRDSRLDFQFTAGARGNLILVERVETILLLMILDVICVHPPSLQ